MKRFSLKKRLSIWYTLSMIVLIIVFIVVIISFGSLEIKESSNKRIEQAVNTAAEKISYNNDSISTNNIDYQSHGVYLEIYDSNLAIVAGKKPKDIQQSIDFNFNNILTVQTGTNTWKIYNKKVALTEHDYVWLRGYTIVSETEKAILSIIKTAFIISPIVIILAIIGGYFITKVGLKPLDKILEKAQIVSRSNDYSQHIETNSGSSEIVQLTDVINIMLEKTRIAFEREKSFTSDASHELRTPVSVIITESDYAISNPESAIRSLHTIRQQAQKVSVILSQLLMLARADNNSVDVHFERLNFSEICIIVAEQQKKAAREKNISILTDVQENIFIMADETLLMRMLMNIVDNAIKYGKKDGNIWMSLKIVNNLAIGSVKDDGIGIASSELDKIWERFYQSGNTTNCDGVGLGLSIVKWIVKFHNGDISVKSIPDKGSEFTFSFPLV